MFIRVAMGQILVESGQLQANLDRAVRAIHLAAAQECSIVVLPECLDLGWTHPSARDLAQPIPGATSEALSSAARAAHIHVVAGLTERADERIYNAAVLIDPEGRLLLKHRKINLLDIEQDLYAIGDRLQVARTPLGVLGVNTCADNFPDSLALGHAIGRMGAQILLSPSAWAVPADHDPEREPYGSLWEGAYTALAPLYEMPIVGVSNVGPITGGPWQGRKCIGCSLAVGAKGEILAKAPYGEEGLFPVEIELTPRRVSGTDIAPMLRGKGYTGP
jgi:predicted amidohydrolase